MTATNSSARKAKSTAAKGKRRDVVAEKAKTERTKLAFVVPSFDGTGTESEAFAAAVVHELAARGYELLVISNNGASADDHVTVCKRTPLHLGRKSIKTFAPKAIVDWGYNMPAEFRRVGSPYEQIVKHSLQNHGGLGRLLKALKLRFSSHHRHHVHREKALMGVSQTVFLASSEGVAADLENAGVQRQRIQVLPYGVDLNRFKPAPLREQRTAVRREQRFAESDVVFLCMTDTEYHLDMDCLHDAFAKAREDHPNIRLLLAGEDCPKWSEPWVARASSEMSAAKLLAGSDALLHPAFYDPGSPMPIQAMAAGIPVITTEAVGEAKFVRDSGSALFAPIQTEGAAEAWTQAVVQLADSEDTRKRLGECGRTAAEQRGLARFVDQLERTLDTKPTTE